MQKQWIPLIVGLIAFPSMALAGPQFTADDIVKHFSNQNAEGGAAKPRTRGVFIGASGFGNEATSAAAAATTTGAAAAKPNIPLTGNKRPKKPKQAAVQMPPSKSDAYDLLITFHVNSDRLTNQARRNLDEFAKALSHPDLSGLRFAVDGHTDATGPDDYNMELSSRRAESVVNYLSDLGVDRSRLQASGYGESRPLMTNPNHPGNRRVETRRLQ